MTNARSKTSIITRFHIPNFALSAQDILAKDGFAGWLTLARSARFA
ncbi:MAG: hypothetical protein WKF30_09280 [Pyrinomonadaceae bacterium]